MKEIIRVVTIGVCTGWGLLAWTAESTYSDPVILNGEKLINVASGDTVIYTGPFSGTGSIRKTGLGTLALANSANVISGGIDVDEGTLRADCQGALGVAEIRITQGETPKGCVSFNAQDAVFQNAFTVSGTYKAGIAALSTLKSVVLKGAVTSADGLQVENYPTGGTKTGGGMHFQSTVWDGSVTVGKGKDLYVRTYGTNVFNGAVAAGSLKLGGTASAGDYVSLGSSGNAFSSISTYQPEIHCFAANVLCEADWSIAKASARNAGRHSLHLHGNDQVLGYISNAPEGATVSEESCVISSELPCVLTLRGGAAGKTHTTGHRFDGKVSIVYNAVNETYVQVIGNLTDSAKRDHTTEGTIRVKNGTLRIAGDKPVFLNMPELAVEETGTLEIATGGQVAFPAVTNVSVSGSLVIAADAQTPFGTAQPRIALNETAALKINGVTEQVFGQVVVGTTSLPKGHYAYPDDRIPQLQAGGFQVVGSGGVTAASWTGAGGAGNEITNVANWSDSAVEFETGALSATFATGGDTAVVSTPVRFRDLTLSAAAGRDGFSFLKGSEEGAIELNGGSLTLAESADEKMYSVGVPLSVNGQQLLSVTVPQNTTLDIAEGLSNPIGSLSFAGDSSGLVGNVRISGESTVSGSIGFSSKFSPIVAGMLFTPEHADQGVAARNGSYTMSILNPGNAAGDPCLYLTNAVIEKPVYLAGDAMPRDRCNIFACAGSTNVVRGNVAFAGTKGTCGMTVATDGELTMSGGLQMPLPFRATVGDRARLVVSGGPVVMKLAASYEGEASFSVIGGEAVFANTSNDVDYLNVGIGNSIVNPFRRVTFAGNDMFGEVTLAVGLYKVAKDVYRYVTTKSISSVVEFNVTTQRFARVLGGPLATFGGSAGSLLEISGDQDAADPLVPDSAKPLAAVFTGGLSLKKTGAGLLVLTNAVSTTTGGLEVSRGELRLAKGVAWTNATSVVVSGTGVLTVEDPQVGGRSRVFGRAASLVLSDDGVLVTPPGSCLHVASLTVDGESMPGGRYTYATAPEAMRHHLSEESGAIQVRGVGLIILLR